jgi:DNA-binding transcriptional MerR regulator
MQETGFSIQFVSKVTGVSAHTLRAWEKRYDAVVPRRNPKGKRLYSQENIKKLKLLTELVQMGNSISDIASLEIDTLEALSLQFGEQKQINNTKQEDVDISGVLKNLLMALRGFKLDIISHEMEKVKQSLNPKDFALKLLLPLLKEVGTMVYAGELSIAQEYAMSAIIKFHSGSILYKHMSTKNAKTKSIVLATPAGELHEFGILISALLCANYDIKFIYLGASMPWDSLSDATNQIGADILLVGVSPMFQTTNTEILEEYFTNVRSSLKSECELWIGGMQHFTKPLMQDGIISVNDLQQLDRKLQALLS